MQRIDTSSPTTNNFPLQLANWVDFFSFLLEVITRFHEKIKTLESTVEEILCAETEERELRAAQAQLEKAEKLASGDVRSSDNSNRRIDWFLERKLQRKREARAGK